MFLNRLNNVGRQLARPAVYAQSRSICTTITNREIFQVQSAEDFDQKVKKSDKPIIVDFFAT